MLYRWNSEPQLTSPRAAGLRIGAATILALGAAACYGPLRPTMTSTLTLAEAVEIGASVEINTDRGYAGTSRSPLVVNQNPQPPEAVETVWIDIHFGFEANQPLFGPALDSSGEDARPVMPVEPVTCPSAADNLLVTINGVEGEWETRGAASMHSDFCEGWRIRFDAGFVDDKLLEVRLEDDTDSWEIDVPWPPVVEVERQVERCVHDVEEVDEVDETLCNEWETLSTDADDRVTIETGEVLRVRYPLPYDELIDSTMHGNLTNDDDERYFRGSFFSSKVTGDADETRATFRIPTYDAVHDGFMDMRGTLTFKGLRCEGPTSCFGQATSQKQLYLQPMKIHYVGAPDEDDATPPSAEYTE